MAGTTQRTLRLRLMYASVVVLVGLGFVAGSAHPAQGDSHQCGSYCTETNPTDPAVVVNPRVVVPGGSTDDAPRDVGESPYGPNCNFFKALAGETHYLHPIAGAWEVTFTEDHWLVWCYPQTVVYAYFPVGDPPPAVIVDDLILDAYDRTPLTFFYPQMSPEGTANIPNLSQIETYLWVEEALWDNPAVATAEIPGMLEVTVTAQAVDATWVGTAEPNTIVCTDHGQPYQPGAATQDDTCSVVFRQTTTPSFTNEMTVTVRWEVNWTCTPGCGGGPLPDLETVTTREVVVGEIQAVGND